MLMNRNEDLKTLFKKIQFCQVRPTRQFLGIIKLKH